MKTWRVDVVKAGAGSILNDWHELACLYTQWSWKSDKMAASWRHGCWSQEPMGELKSLLEHLKV